MHVSQPLRVEDFTSGGHTLARDDEQLHAHLLHEHQRTPLELLVMHDHLEVLHRFEHFEASVGLVEVDHEHGLPATRRDQL